MRFELPAEVALAASMAARRVPGPVLPRLLTTNVCVYVGVRTVEACAKADPAVKATAEETPAIKATAPAIRGMNRPARIIRLSMKTTCMAREDIISFTSSFLFGGEDASLWFVRLERGK
jgi:hypothetical protein